MKLLLDTHTLLWWFTDDPTLPPSNRGADRRSLQHDTRECGVSVGGLHEGAHRQIADRLALCGDFSGYLTRFHFTPLAISVEHGRLAGHLPGPHKDPFDRMLAAQALVEGVPLVTNDPAFAGLGVKVVW